MGILLVGEGVHVRLDVAGAARIGVVAPGAADLVGLLQDHEIGDAGVLELDGHAEPGEPGTNDDDLGTLPLHHLFLHAFGVDHGYRVRTSRVTSSNGYW
jgi:hypothetical protein